MRKEFTIGILMLSIELLLTRFISIPDFISGMLLGVACCCFIISVIPINNFVAFKKWKSQRLASGRK